MSNWKNDIINGAKARLGESAEMYSDALLNEYLEDGVRDIVEYGNLKAYDKRYDNVLKKYIVLACNTQGIEGERSHQSNGITRNYGIANPLSLLIASNVKQALRPLSFVYPADRFDLPISEVEEEE